MNLKNKYKAYDTVTYSTTDYQRYLPASYYSKHTTYNSHWQTIVSSSMLFEEGNKNYEFAMVKQRTAYLDSNQGHRKTKEQNVFFRLKKKLGSDVVLFSPPFQNSESKCHAPSNLRSTHRFTLIVAYIFFNELFL
ncbi:hypothetical protein TNCV_4879701 [Trichonephila clavipes]|nr:hypothetical protein TNCV_4879701 [Trichonephila clavipes]